jgi:hypothetical protein
MATEHEMLRAIPAGADGYPLKATTPERLSAALRAVAGGQATLPRVPTIRILEELRRSSIASDPVEVQAQRATVASLLLYPPLYAPRFVRHFHRRWRSGMSLRTAWISTRTRMLDYRFRPRPSCLGDTSP